MQLLGRGVVDLWRQRITRRWPVDSALQVASDGVFSDPRTEIETSVLSFGTGPIASHSVVAPGTCT